MLNIEQKEDSAEKLAAVQGKPTKHYLFAPEFNSIVNKVNEFDNFINPDRILSLGTETIDGNNYSYQGYSWQIAGVSYLMVVPEVITIPAASVGFKRKDIAVFTSSGTIVRVPGTETDADIVATPDVPQGTLYFKSYDIDGNTIAVDPEPIVIDGSQFKKKAESQSVTLSLNFESGKLPLLPNGASYYKIQSLELVELTGFSRDLLTGASTDEPPYEGKEYWFENNTPNPITLLNNAQPTDAFKLNASTLVVPSGGKVMFKFLSGFFTEIFKLFDSELDLQAVLLNGNSTDRAIRINDEDGNSLLLRIRNGIPQINMNRDTDLGNLTSTYMAGVISMIQNFAREANLSPNSLAMTDYSAGRTLNVTNNGINCNQYNLPSSPNDYIQRKYVDDLNFERVLVRQLTPTAPVTGTTSETVVYTWFIPANTFNTEDWFKIEDLTTLSNSNVLANVTVRVRFNDSNTLDTSTSRLLATAVLASGGLANVSRYNKFTRTFDVFGGNIGTAFTIAGLNNDFLTNTYSINSFNTTIDNWLFVTIQLGNASDSINMKNLIIKK